MEQPNDQSTPNYVRWIPIVVPLAAVLVVSGVYFIAAEVLARAG